MYERIGKMTLPQFKITLFFVFVVLVTALTVRSGHAMAPTRETAIHEWVSCLIDRVEYHLVVQGSGDQIERVSLIAAGVHRRDMKLEWNAVTEQWHLKLGCKEHLKCVPCQLEFISSPDRPFSCEEEYWELATFELGVLQKIERKFDLHPLLRKGIKMLSHEEILPRLNVRIVPSPSGPPPGDGPSPLP